MSKPQHSSNKHASSKIQSLRIDKWLWSARFFKTRSLASDAVKTGKVLVNGEKIKASKEITAGDTLTIKQSIFTKTILVLALSNRRGPASVAAELYQETPDSIARRKQLKEIQLAQPALRRPGHGRPTKRERRQIISFTGKSKV